MKFLFDYLSGYRYFYFPPEEMQTTSSLLIDNVVPHFSRIRKDGKQRIKVRRRYCKKTTELFQKNGVIFESSVEKGLPAIAKKLLRRPGLIAGLFSFIIISWFLSRLVWDVRITDDCSFDNEDVEEMLLSEGFSYGTFYPKTDFDSLNSRIMASYPDVAWISVNMKGNVAEVEIRRAEHGELPAHSEGVFANVVASEDARIYLAHTDEGTSEIKDGDVVKKGDLLISGIVPMRNGGVRFVYASGEVMADVNRSVSVKIEKYVKNNYFTGRSVTDTGVIFFKKRVNLFPNRRIKYTTYDKIEKKERLVLFGKIELPVWINKTEYREYKEYDSELTPEESLVGAKIKLRKLMDDVLRDAELISKKVILIPEDDGIVLRCDMVCRVDIGQTVEFDVFGTDEIIKDAEKK